MYYERPPDYRPLFWWHGRPIHLVAFLIILHVIACFVTAICMSTMGPLRVLAAISLNTEDVFRGEVWRLFSYIINPPSLWFVFAMGFFFFAGRELEQFVGWKTVGKLYAALVLIPAVIFCLIGLIWPMSHLGGTESIFGIFVAFATVYPGMVLPFWFVNLTTKGWALVLLSIYTLMDMAYNNWPAMLILWLSAGIGYGGMRLIGAGYGMTWLTDWLEDRRTERLARERNLKVLKDTQETESIDAILEKISKQGVNSLSARERKALEEARTNLLKRDQR